MPDERANDQLQEWLDSLKSRRAPSTREWLDAIKDSNLPRVARSVAAWLASHFDNVKLSAHPTQATLSSEVLGTDERLDTISKNIRLLVERGFLAKKRIKRQMHYCGLLPTAGHSARNEPPDRRFNATVAPLVREYLWASETPPPSPRGQRDWSMDRELDIARRLAEDHGVDAVIGAIPFIRSTYGFNGGPCTLRLVWRKGSRGRFHECIAAWRSASASADVPYPESLRRIDE